MVNREALQLDENSTTSRPSHEDLCCDVVFDLINPPWNAATSNTQGTFHVPIIRLYPKGESMMCQPNDKAGDASYYHRNKVLNAGTFVQNHVFGPQLGPKSF